MCPLTLLALNENVSLLIRNKRNVEIMIYRPGEEFWFTLARFPMSVGSAKIESKNSDQMVSADVKVFFTITIFARLKLKRSKVFLQNLCSFSVFSKIGCFNTQDF